VAESYMDDDGVKLGVPVAIKVSVIVEDEEITVDLSEVGNQVKGFYNSGETAGLSCAGVAFKCLTSPTSYPINAGSFRPLKVILPPGKVVSAQKPAAMRWWMTYPMTIVDTIFKALAPAVPEKIIAAHHADLLAALIHGHLPNSEQLFIYLGGLVGGGWGAKFNEDGVNATICINDGDTHNGPSEQVEAKYPLLVEQYRLRDDSGGAGRQRGGLGCEQVVRALEDIMFNAQVERVQCRPWGLFDGLSGAGNEVSIRRQGKEPERYPTGKVVVQAVARRGRLRHVLRWRGWIWQSPRSRTVAGRTRCAARVHQPPCCSHMVRHPVRRGRGGGGPGGFQRVARANALPRITG